MDPLGQNKLSACGCEFRVSCKNLSNSTDVERGNNCGERARQLDPFFDLTNMSYAVNTVQYTSAKGNHDLNEKYG